MLVSQKCQYALRAIFELAKHYGNGPMRISEIADTQAIPPRFLETILCELKQGGLVRSRRGVDGGYMLTRDPDSLTVGEVITFVEGPVGPVSCVSQSEKDSYKQRCPLHEHCVFLPVWRRAQKAVSDVYDTTTIGSLVAEEARMRAGEALSYSI